MLVRWRREKYVVHVYNSVHDIVASTSIRFVFVVVVVVVVDVSASMKTGSQPSQSFKEDCLVGNNPYYKLFEAKVSGDGGSRDGDFELGEKRS